jgi:hypothetical protein
VSNKKDHLDNEVSVTGTLTESGVKLRAKSRAVSGADRLLGNLSEMINAPMELRNARIRAEKEFIEALGQAAAQRVREDPTFIDRFAQHQLARNASRYLNTEAVVGLAIEDLSADPPTPEQCASGPEVLDSAFMNRFERLAEDASDDVAREKWAKVLAGEIRRPGTCTAKVLRIIDELMPEVAHAFEDFCQYRLGSTVPLILSGEIPFGMRKHFELAGLLMPSETGTVRIFQRLKNANGTEAWVGDFEYRAVAFPISTEIPKGSKVDMTLDPPGPFADSTEARLSCPVYKLTDEGEVIAMLMNDRQSIAWQKFFEHILAFLPGVEIEELVRKEHQLTVLRIVRGPVAAPGV